MSKPKRDTVFGNCSYCGLEQKLEPEHVVPRAIFVRRNQSTIVIPACEKCNREKSAGEDDLRDYLVITVGVHGHNDILPLMQVMAKATGKGFSKLGRAASTERKAVLQRTSAGVTVPVYEVPFHDPKPMQRTLRYMVRGLYFHENRRPWLLDQPMALHVVAVSERESTLTNLDRVGPVTFSKPMGNGVFKYASVTQPEHPEVTAWGLDFFGQVLVIGITGIPEEPEEHRAPTFQELLRRKGRREDLLRGIVDRRLVKAPPDDVLGFLRLYEQRNQIT